MPKISVVMPVYNTKEEWLREAIESILNQTYSDFEFIIINDGSENGTEDVILSYKDKRIKYIKNEENLGIARSRNKANKLAQGEYIAIMDSDDIALPERFEKQVKFLDNNPEVSVLGTWFEFFPEAKIVEHPQNLRYLDILKGCFVGHPTVMLKKKDFEKYDIKYKKDFICAHDYELWSNAVRYLKFHNLPEILLKYRWHGNNISKPCNELTKDNEIIRKNMLDFLTDDKELQKEIIGLITEIKKPTFLQQIFSIRNEGDLKIMRILGIKILIGRKNK